MVLIRNFLSFIFNKFGWWLKNWAKKSIWKIRKCKICR